MLTERIIRLNDKVRNTEPTIDLDRARLITEFYSQPSMENYVLRRAKAFKYFLENKKIFMKFENIGKAENIVKISYIDNSKNLVT